MFITERLKPGENLCRQDMIHTLIREIIKFYSQMPLIPLSNLVNQKKTIYISTEASLRFQGMKRRLERPHTNLKHISN